MCKTLLNFNYSPNLPRNSSSPVWFCWVSDWILACLVWFYAYIAENIMGNNQNSLGQAKKTGSHVALFNMLDVKCVFVSILVICSFRSWILTHHFQVNQRFIIFETDQAIWDPCFILNWCLFPVFCSVKWLCSVHAVINYIFIWLGFTWSTFTEPS